MAQKMAFCTLMCRLRNDTQYLTVRLSASLAVGALICPKKHRSKNIRFRKRKITAQNSVLIDPFLAIEAAHVHDS